LTHVPSQSSNQADFSQHLVFVILAGDLGGRFLTVIAPRLPDKWAALVVLVLALIQFVFLDVVLLYIYGNRIIPLSDLTVQISLVIFSMATGYLQTQSYAYAAIGVPIKYRTQVGALMNVATQAGNFLGLGLSFTLRLVFQ